MLDDLFFQRNVWMLLIAVCAIFLAISSYFYNKVSNRINGLQRDNQTTDIKIGIHNAVEPLAQKLDSVIKILDSSNINKSDNVNEIISNIDGIKLVTQKFIRVINENKLLDFSINELDISPKTEDYKLAFSNNINDSNKSFSCKDTGNHIIPIMIFKNNKLLLKHHIELLLVDQFGFCD